MQPTTPRAREGVTALLSRPDEMLLEVGAGGELLVARLRAIVAAVLLLLPLANAMIGGTVRETMIGLGGAVFVNVFAHIWLALAHKLRKFRWLSFATAAFDVTAATLILIVLSTIHFSAALNSMIVWCGYLIAIVLTALRSDGRVTLFAGGLAILQYVILIIVLMNLADSPDQLISSEHGTVTLANQVQRVIMLFIVMLITAMVVYRIQHLVELAGTDGLTRLPNRTWLVHRMPRLFDNARAHGGSLTLALIDLDHFKRVNDEAGHQTGDRALKHVVDLLRESSEQGEWLVRLGGEEFVMVMRKPIGTAWERLDAIRRVVADHPFEERGRDPFRITFSAGLAAYMNDGVDLSQLLRRADQRLQQAKREGRNRVVARDV